jgi:hypothetical protein
VVWAPQWLDSPAKQITHLLQMQPLGTPYKVVERSRQVLFLALISMSARHPGKLEMRRREPQVNGKTSSCSSRSLPLSESAGYES